MSYDTTGKDRRVTLEPPDKFDQHALANVTVWWASHSRNRTSMPMSRGEIQQFVNAAAKEYRIRPTCDCYPGGFTPEAFEGPKEDCPEHGRKEGNR